MGSSFILVAAILWGADSLFRWPLIGELPVDVIVMVEQLGGSLLLAALVLRRHGPAGFRRLATLPRSLMIPLGGSAVGCLLYSQSLHDLNPSVAVLLQKLQPLFVLGGAYLWLGERPRRRFLLWAGIALASACALSFMEPGHSGAGAAQTFRGCALALGATTLWALSTVGSKGLLDEAPPLIVAMARFTMGSVTLLPLLILRLTSGGGLPLETLAAQSGALAALVLLGATATAFYAAGLRRISASAASFMELAYPVSALILNSAVLGKTLTPPQGALAAALLLSVGAVGTRPVLRLAWARPGKKPLSSSRPAVSFQALWVHSGNMRAGSQTPIKKAPSSANL